MDNLQPKKTFERPAFAILAAVSLAHLLNDLMQSVIPAMYPYLQQKYSLSMAQIGVITFCFQLAASLFQPLVGNYTDRKPQPYSQVIGMLFSGAGMFALAYANTYALILLAVTLVGVGSSIFHPESARVASLASGGRRSFAQAFFQIGGNVGAALAPLLIAWIILPNEQRYMVYFCAIALIGQLVLWFIGRWYSKKLQEQKREGVEKKILVPDLPSAVVHRSVLVLMLLIISKYFYTASIMSYFQFYTIDKFGITEVQAQVYLFYFLISIAVGALVGGTLGDIFGRKSIIWFSVFGVAPFTLMLPYANLFWTGILIVIIGFTISSAFPSILVFAQELLPKKLGMISGLFYGFAFGMGGLGSALLGILADYTSVAYVYKVCSFLPLLGIVTFLLPNMSKVRYTEAS